jgi:hypothetical protein
MKPFLDSVTRLGCFALQRATLFAKGPARHRACCIEFSLSKITKLA